MTGIVLVPIYLSGSRSVLLHLPQRLGESFRARVEVRLPWFDPESCFDSTRGQYNSTLLLARLQEAASAGSSQRVLGLTGVDLFIPVLSYVFGEAQLPGRAAVVSLHRLAPELYGLPKDDARLIERTEKVAIHELGHTFGLVHCRQARCVMRSSTYVEDIDLKTDEFCDDCLAGLLAGGAAELPRFTRME